MNKKIKNVFLIVCTATVAFAIPLLLSHDSPIPVQLVELNSQEITAQKEATAKAEKEAQRRASIARTYSCQTDEDCIVVDKDPCGCTIGPKGIVAINVNHVVDFNAVNNQKSVTTTCPEKISQEKECSPTARPVCKARRCKIVY